VYGNLGLKIVLPMVHPTALAVAELAAPRLAAGEGVDAALAAPHSVRDKVAFTREELERS
jgi:tRNA threonylcarbamoyladenosine biosynthesis protein TsaB